MPKYLALEWDDHEMRLAIATQRGATAVLERAFSVPLPPAHNQPHTAEKLAAVLRETLAGESLRRLETMAVVGRPSIELKELSLPPAPDDELPDMVRFQALRDFTQLSEDTPLDFIPLPGEDAEHRSVLAAAISQELLNEISSTCQQAGLELKHVVLRPCAAAALLARHHPAAGQVRMFVDLLGDEVDLTVLDQDTPLLMRTTRLPGDASEPEYCRPVFLEIRRTIAAVQNKLHGRRVEQIWLCGDGASQQTLAEMAKSELDLPTELFDPFTAFAQAGGLANKLPQHHSRFAPLLGMLAEAAAGKRHAIDFLEPRRRPVPKSRRRELALGVACAAVVILGFVGWTWWRANSLDNEIAGLQSRKTALDRQITKKKQVLKEADELDKWLGGDIAWLDELYRLSTQGPKGEAAMLTALKAEVDPRGAGAKLTMDVLTNDSEKVQNQLRMIYSKTRPGTIEESDGKIKRYPWKFNAESKLDAPRHDEVKKPATSKTGVTPVAPKETVPAAQPEKKEPKVDSSTEKAVPTADKADASKPVASPSTNEKGSPSAGPAKADSNTEATTEPASPDETPKTSTTK